jgi:hypothetical protein
VFTTETGGDRTLFEGVEDGVTKHMATQLVDMFRCHRFWIAIRIAGKVVWDKDLRWSEKLLEHHVHAAEDLCHEEVFAGLVQGGLGVLIPALGRGQAEPGLRGSRWACCAVRRGREVCGRAQQSEGGRPTVGD